MSPEFFLNIILFGGIYIGVGLSINLILGVMRLINVANGELIMLGAYAAWLFSLVGIPPLASLPLAFIVNSLIGLLSYESSIKKVMTRPDPGMSALLVTYGFSMLMMNLVILIFTADYRGLITPLPSVSVFGVNIPIARLIASIIGLAFAFSLYIFLRTTYLGKAIRAVASNKMGASIVGIDINKIYRIVYVIGYGLAGACGSILALMFPVYPTMGQLFGPISLCLVVLGGMGSYIGLIAAAFTLSFIENVCAYMTQFSLKPLVAFLIIMMALLVRPKELHYNIKKITGMFRHE